MSLRTLRRFGRPLVLLALAWLLTSTAGCAYFNTFYLARKYYRMALVEEKKNTTGKVSPQASQHYEKSIKQCSKVLQRYGQSKWADDAIFLMGQAYFGQEQYASARRWFGELITRFPKSPYIADARLWSARSWLAQDDFEQAAAGLAEVIEKHPDYREMDAVLFYQAEISQQQEKYADAIPLYQGLVERYPKSPRMVEALLRLGEAHMGVKQYDEARRTFEMAAARTVEPRQRFQSLLKAGQALERLDKNDDALKLYGSLSAELVSRDRLAVILTGFDNVTPTASTQINTGRVTEQDLAAYTFIDSAGNTVLRNPAFSNQYPPVAANLSNPVDPNDPDAAADEQARRKPPAPGSIIPEGNLVSRTAASQALAANPLASELPRVLLSQGAALMEVGRYDDAIRTFKAVLAAWPRTSESGEALYKIGYIQELYQEDYAAARVSYDGVRQQGPSLFADQASRRASGLARLVALAQADTSMSGAGQEVEKAAEQEFLAAELAYFQQERPDKAVEQYTAVELNYPSSSFAPRSAMARAWILYFAQDDTALGRAAYEAVVEKYPKSEQARLAHQMLTGEAPVEEISPDSLLAIQTARAADSLAAESSRDSSGAEPRGDLPIATNGAAPDTSGPADIAPVALVSRPDSVIADRSAAVDSSGAVRPPDGGPMVSTHSPGDSTAAVRPPAGELIAAAHPPAGDSTMTVRLPAPVSTAAAVITAAKPSSRLAPANATGLPRPVSRSGGRGFNRGLNQNPPPSPADTTRTGGGR